MELTRSPGEQGGIFVFPQGLTISRPERLKISRWLTGIGSLDQYYAWARAHGGIDPKVVLIRLVLAGNRADAIRILDMEPVGSCSAPLKGAILYVPPAGVDNNVYIGLNLNKQFVPAQLYSAAAHSFGSPYFDTHSISLKYQEQKVFRIAGVSSSRYCQFRLRLTILEKNGKVTQVIGDGKKPFRVTGLPFTPLNPSLASYGKAYVGGVASCDGSLFEVDPATFRAGVRVCH